MRYNTNVAGPQVAARKRNVTATGPSAASVGIVMDATSAYGLLHAAHATSRANHQKPLRTDAYSLRQPLQSLRNWQSHQILAI